MARTPFIEVGVNYITNGTGVSESNNALLISQRGTRNGAATKDLNDLALYTSFRIPAQQVSSPTALLNYFKDTINATVETGVEDTINLVAPDSTSEDTVNGIPLTSLTWIAEPAGWDDIVGITIVGSATQGAVSGVIYSVSSSGYVLQVSTVTGGSFTTASPIVLKYTNKSIQLPDGDATELFVLDAYYASSALVGLASTANVNVTIPELYLLIVSDKDSLFNANSTPLPLGNVDSVINNMDGTLSLVWDTEPVNWKYVPENGLGDSQVEGALPADIAIIEKELPGQYALSGSGYVLLVTPEVGASFVASDPITMVLDDTVSLFDQIKTENYKFFNVHYEMTNTTDATTGAGVLFPFTQFLEERNADVAVQNQSFGSFGLVGTTTLTVAEYNTLAPIDKSEYSTPMMYYKQTFNDPTIGGGELAAAQTAVLASNTVPFSNMNKFVLNGFPVSSDKTSYISVSTVGDSETLLDKGATAIAVNAQGQAYMVAPITTQVTIPGSGEPDNQFYDMHTQQIIIELKARTWAVGEQPTFDNANITPRILSLIEGSVFGMLVQAQNQNMITDVLLLKPTILAVQNGTDPDLVNITYDIKIPVGLIGQSYIMNVVASTQIVTTQA